MLKAGIKGRAEDTVTEETTAVRMLSGTAEVYATPCMIALIEKAAGASVQPFLEEGCATVGTKISVEHLSATPLGMKVWAESELTEVRDRKLSFAVRAFDEKGLIGEGTHERFVVDVGRFMKRAESKKSS